MIVCRRRSCGPEMMARSRSVGERAAAIYSLIRTAKLNALDSDGHLRNVLAGVDDHPTRGIAERLPWNVAVTVPAIT
jgi:transposase